MRRMYFYDSVFRFLMFHRVTSASFMTLMKNLISIRERTEHHVFHEQWMCKVSCHMEIELYRIETRETDVGLGRGGGGIFGGGMEGGGEKPWTLSSS